jgi:hypothetical protein
MELALGLTRQVLNTVAPKRLKIILSKKIKNPAISQGSGKLMASLNSNSIEELGVNHF